MKAREIEGVADQVYQPTGLIRDIGKRVAMDFGHPSGSKEHTHILKMLRKRRREQNRARR